MRSHSPLNARIADQELTTQLPRNPEKKPTVWHASSRDITLCNKLSSLSAPATPTPEWNTAELPTAQDTPAHLEGRPPFSMTSWMAASVEKSCDTTVAQQATEFGKSASAIRPLCNPDKPPIANCPRPLGASKATSSPLLPRNFEHCLSCSWFHPSPTLQQCLNLLHRTIAVTPQGFLQGLASPMPVWKLHPWCFRHAQNLSAPCDLEDPELLHPVNYVLRLI